MSVVHEVLGAVRVVKAFGREDHEHQRFVRGSSERLAAQVRVAFVQSGFDLLLGMTTATGTAAALWIGVMHVRSGVLTLGALLVVMAYLSQLYSPLSTLSKLLTDLQSAMAAPSGPSLSSTRFLKSSNGGTPGPSLEPREHLPFGTCASLTARLPSCAASRSTCLRAHASASPGPPVPGRPRSPVC